MFRGHRLCLCITLDCQEYWEESEKVRQVSWVVEPYQLRLEQKSIAKNLALDRTFWHLYKASRTLYPTGYDTYQTSFALTFRTLMVRSVVNAYQSVCISTRVSI